MRLHRGPSLGRKRAVQICRKVAERMHGLASYPYDAAALNRFPHPLDPFQPRLIRMFRTARRPLWMRDFTVPISVDVIVAISS